MKSTKPLFRTITTGLLLALFVAVGSVSGAYAAEPADTPTESITLSPASSRLRLDAGAVETGELTVLNDGDIAYDFIVYARPYSIQNNNYEKPDFTGTPSNADAYRWVQFAETSWRIEPGDTLKIPYSLRVPADAAPGGHYGVIFVETQPTGADGISVARKKRVGSLLYVTVNGTFRTGGQILGAEVPWLQFRAPLMANVMVENTGNADFDATVNYKVTDIFGRTKYDATKDYVVLPKTVRKINIEWGSAPWFGLFNVALTTNYLDQSSSSRSLVLLVPRWLLYTVLVIFVGGGAYVALRRRRRS